MKNIFTTTPTKAKPLLEKCIKTGLVPFLQSSPGIGKSSIIKQIASEYNLEVIDLRLSMCSPEDLNGLPRFKDNKAEFVPFALFPLADTPVPEGKDGWVLFLDEFNSASRSVQAACYKLILDRQVGMYPLHPKTALVAAGNLTTDHAITNQLSTAMQSRLVQLKLEPSLEDWMTNVAIPQKYDERIISFLNFSSDSLMRFEPEKQAESPHPFPCPRTWEFVDKLIKDEDDLERLVPLLAGTIGEPDAISFVQFAGIYQNLPKLKDILSGKVDKVPSDTPTQWAVLTNLAINTDMDNFKKVLDYVDKFSLPLQIVYMNSVVQYTPEILTHPAYAKKGVQTLNYLRN